MRVGRRYHSWREDIALGRRLGVKVWIRNFWTFHLSTFGAVDKTIVGASTLLSAAVAIFAPHVARSQKVPSDFFLASATVLPLFLVAFAVERRLSERLGRTVEQAANDAEAVFAKTMEIHKAAQRSPEEVMRMRRDLPRQDRWVHKFSIASVVLDGASSDVREAARRRYWVQQRGEAVLVIAALGLILAGEVAAALALTGSSATSASSILFRITAGCLSGTIVIVVLAAMRDLLPALISLDE